MAALVTHKVNTSYMWALISHFTDRTCEYCKEPPKRGPKQKGR